MTTDISSSEQLEPIRVLLVDDHDHVLWGLRKLIEGERPRMVVAGTAKTGSQALAALRESQVDVVVLDLYLDERNSLEYLPAIRASGAVVVILTGAQEAEMHRHAMQVGARNVVLKEESAEVLLHEIERADEWRRSGAEDAAREQDCQSAVEARIAGFISSTKWR